MFNTKLKMTSRKIMTGAMVGLLCSIPLSAAGKKSESDLLISTPALVEAGKAKFATMCASCHGPTGKGDTEVAKALKPPPRNLADAKIKWKVGKEPLQVYETIVKGIPGTAMVGLGATMTEEERWGLVHFINSLAGSKGSITPITKKNLPAKLKELKKIQKSLKKK